MGLLRLIDGCHLAKYDVHPVSKVLATGISNNFYDLFQKNTKGVYRQHPHVSNKWCSNSPNRRFQDKRHSTTEVLLTSLVGDFSSFHSSK